MKKKLLSILLIVFLIIGLTGCNNNSQQTESQQSNKSTYKIGDSIESDIIKLKLDTSQFAVALVNTIGKKLGTAKEYNAKDDANNIYVAAKGHTLVAFTFTIENLDRKSIDIGGQFNKQFASISYKGNTYNSVAKFVAESKDGLTWDSYKSANILLNVGEVVKYRAYIDIPTEVENLNDSFELSFYLPNSNGETNCYTFIVTEEDRSNIVEDEISLDTAFKNFSDATAYDYFIKHYADFEVMTESELTEYINSIIGMKIKQIHNSFSDDGKKIGHGQGNYEFISTGDIKDDYGLVNKNKWKLDGNKLIFSYTTDNGEHVRNCEVRKIPNKGKLLIWEGKPYGVLY